MEEWIIELQDMLEAEREVRERGDREYEELREKYAEVVGKYGKLKGKFTTLSARAAESEKSRNERIALEVKLREVETRLSEREQYLKEESELKDMKMEEFRARLKDYVVRLLL